MSAADGQMQVNPNDLVAHARKIDEIGDGLAMAQEAGAAVRTDAGEYGQLCQFVPSLLNAMQSQMIDGLATAARSVHDTADGLREVAAAYDDTDHNTADRIRNAR
ncbi:type VII secretion target [Actinoplanes sp. NPDC051494]|uniref:type VII secretion target n=1 Tax=Actinoplanes sp. NPDC051494 TaxID=3363907 RepID=UPI0037A037A4